jgi:hypothetical protein
VSGSAFVFIWYYKASVFSMFSIITLNIVFSCGEDSFFLAFVLRYFVSGVCLFVYYTCLLFVYFVCAGSVGISLAGRVIYILCVCDSAVWSVGPVQFVRALSWSGWRDCTDFFFFWLSFFPGCVVAGTVQLNW